MARWVQACVALALIAAWGDRVGPGAVGVARASALPAGSATALAMTIPPSGAATLGSPQLRDRPSD